MKFNEYIPRGFNSWHHFNKYQLISDIIAGIVVLCLGAVCLFTLII